MPVATSGHAVLPSADAEPFASLRRRPTPRAERYRMGRHCANRCRGRRWGTGRRRPADRTGAADHGSHEGRLDWLIPVRVGRMVASPYGFLRGTAIVMAEDVGAPAGHRDHAGDLRRRAPGQLRLLRLARARPGDRPERLRRGAPRRLGVGPAPAGRQHLGGRPAERGHRGAVRGARSLAAWRRTARRCAGWPSSRCWPAPTSGWTSTGCTRAPPTRRCARRSSGPRAGPGPTSDRALPRFTEEHDGRPPDRRGAAADHPGRRRGGRAARPGPGRVPRPPWRRTGAGRSAATRWSTSRTRWSAWAASGCAPTSRCCEGSSPDDVVFLQLKQARRSVLARYVHGDSAWHAHQGQRVVEYQQALQTVSDPLLGWTTVRTGSTTSASSGT